MHKRGLPDQYHNSIGPQHEQEQDLVIISFRRRRTRFVVSRNSIGPIRF